MKTEGVNISTLIESKIIEFISSSGRSPCAIIIHPDSYKRFMIELSSSVIGGDFGTIKTPKYRDIKIYRTEDQEENKIKVCG